MTPDLTEQRLREQLHAAAEAQAGSYVDVDPLTALGTGQRVLRRRRIATVAGTAAAALAIGLGGWAVLSNQTPDERTLPAVTSTITGDSVTLDLGAAPDSGSTEPLAAVVTVDDVTGKVEFRLQTETGSVLNSQVRTDSGEQVSWTSLSESAMVAIVPADATAFVPVWGGDVTALANASERLPDGRVAAAWLTDQPETGTHLSGVVWTDGTDAYDVAGTELDSVVVDDDIVVWANPRSGAMGYVRPDVGSLSGSGDVRQAREAPVGQFPGVWVPDPSGERGVFAAYLPPLAEEIRKQVTVETTAEGTVVDLETFRPSQVLLLVAHVDGPADCVTGVKYPGSETQERFSS